MNDLLFERVRIALRAAHSLNHFCPVLGFGGVLRVFLDGGLCGFGHSKKGFKGGIEKKKVTQPLALRGALGLLDFFVNGITLHGVIVLSQFNALRRVFLVLNGDIAAGAGQSRGFVLGAFQNYLNAVSFLSGHKFMLRLK